MMSIAPTIAATAAKIAPPATPLSATNNICPSLLAVLEQLGQEVSVAVFVPAGTGPEAYTISIPDKNRKGEVREHTLGPAP